MTRHVLHEFMTDQLDQPASCRRNLVRDIFVSLALTAAIVVVVTFALKLVSP
jgi:hypothetical protein